jgi:hypothetical protein
MTPNPPSTEQLQRARAAPLGLLLLGWGLGFGPVAHAVVAHGDPVLRDSGDTSWAQHTRGSGGERSPVPTHRHAPGALEHLQLVIASVAVALVVAAFRLRVRSALEVAWRGPFLPRWWLPEVPCGP